MSKIGSGTSNFTTSTAVKTAILVWGITNRRAEVVELLMTGSGLATPAADIPVLASACYCSLAVYGVGTTTTPEKMSGQNAPAPLTCMTLAMSTEPTAYSAAFPVLFGFNTRGGNKFSVPQGEGLRIDSVATANRLGWRAQASSGTPGIDAECQAWED